MVKCFKTRPIICFWAALLLTVGWAAVAWPKGEQRANVALEADGRAFTFRVPDVISFRGGFSATVMKDGQTQKVCSSEGKLAFPVEPLIEDTPCGRVEVSEATLRFEKEQVNLLCRVGRLPGGRGLVAQAGVCNTGFKSLRLLSLTPVAMEGQAAGVPAEWLVTGLGESVKDTPPVVALNAIQRPLSVFEYGGFYRGDGLGFFFGPVGNPIAYVQASIEHKGGGKVAFVFAADMSGVQVKPGETRWGQQVALLAEPPRTALPHWAEWVAQTHGARTDKGALAGWNSWLFHGHNITGKDVLAEVNVVMQAPGRLRPQVMEIDAGYEPERKPGETNEKFSQGLAFYAEHIAATGARPGLLVSFKGRPGWSTILDKIRHAVKNGYTYLKINRTGLSLRSEELLFNTSFEAKRQGFALLREVAGADTYLLYNDSRPDRATVGLVDANRTGVGSERPAVRAAMTDVLRAYHLNGRWFAVDNDSYYMGTDIANVSEIAGGWPLVRTWMSMVGLSCGAALTADPWHWESFRPYWRNVEVMTPPARERTEVLDLCTDREWPRLLGHVRRKWGNMTVALLWNPDTAERTVTLDFAKAGMHPRRRYAVWSFWDNRYLGVVQGAWKTPPLGPSASQHLCFTELGPGQARDKPLLIGSSLHIYCGASEIKHVSCSRAAMEIELTDAGARDGDLFIYSRRQPVWKGEEGCTVAEIASAGEYVWRVNLVDRQAGVPQRVVLGILLPVTRQIWFWALIATVVASLLLAGWRYLVGVRLARERVMEQERGRIARDIHDGLGVSLTQIALQCEVMQDDVEQPTLMRHHVAELSQSSQAVTRALDEIVWAVTPTNDTVEHFVTFVGQFVENCLSHAGLICRLSLPVDPPDLPMSATVRHQLFLVLREALNNAIRHAKASTVRFALTLEERQLTMTVVDDGRGFDPENIFPASTDRVFGGNGLANMRKRMEEIGGTVELASKRNGGTTLTFQVRL